MCGDRRARGSLNREVRYGIEEADMYLNPES